MKNKYDEYLELFHIKDGKVFYDNKEKYLMNYHLNMAKTHGWLGDK